MILAFKPSQRQWDEHLGGLPKHKRTVYVRGIFEAFIKEHPRLQVIPLHEPPNESLYAKPIGVPITVETAAWFETLPSQMRSYVARYMLKWYWRQHPPNESQRAQITLDELASTSRQKTGTG